MHQPHSRKCLVTRPAVAWYQVTPLERLIIINSSVHSLRLYDIKCGGFLGLLYGGIRSNSILGTSELIFWRKFPHPVYCTLWSRTTTSLGFHISTMTLPNRYSLSLSVLQSVGTGELMGIHIDVTVESASPRKLLIGMEERVRVWLAGRRCVLRLGFHPYHKLSHDARK